MELSVTEIAQRKKEIDELANLHHLEDWQKDRLFQEYVRRKSQGYEATLLDIAKEWGWLGDGEIVDEKPQIVETITPQPLPEVSAFDRELEDFAKEHNLDSFQKDKLKSELEIRKSQGKEIALLDLAKELGLILEQKEVVATPEVPAIETQKPTHVQPPQPEQQVVASAPAPVQGPAFSLDFNKIVGYKPADGYLDPNKIAKMASDGPLDDASTWIATVVGRAARRLGLWG